MGVLLLVFPEALELLHLVGLLDLLHVLPGEVDEHRVYRRPKDVYRLPLVLLFLYLLAHQSEMN